MSQIVETTATGGLAAARPRLAAALDLVREAAWTQRWFLGLVALYLAAGWATAAAVGRPDAFQPGLYSATWAKLLVTFLVFTLLVGYPLYVMVVLRPARPLRIVLQGWRRLALDRGRLVRAVPILLALPLFTSTFTSLKALIPAVAPYSWDPTFVAWDRWLHFGVDPWALLHPLIGFPVATVAINVAYNAWFFVLGGVTFWQIFQTSDLRLRLQYLLCLVLVWGLGGNALAMAFSSVGPCFYGPLLGQPDPFVPLMDYLRATEAAWPVWAIATQDMLWAAYAEGDLQLGSGISAMPSMHVATAVLMALLGFRVSRWAGWALTAFAVVVQIGSVHLAWHYAIDGYLSAVFVVALWWGVGRALRLVPARSL